MREKETYLVPKVGSIVVSGFGLMDIVEGGEEVVTARFPQLSLTARWVI